MEEEIRSILKEAYSRNDLGEDWAVSEMCSLFFLRNRRSRVEVRDKTIREMVEFYNLDKMGLPISREDLISRLCKHPHFDDVWKMKEGKDL